MHTHPSAPPPLRFRRLCLITQKKRVYNPHLGNYLPLDLLI